MSGRDGFTRSTMVFRSASSRSIRTSFSISFTGAASVIALDGALLLDVLEVCDDIIAFLHVAWTVGAAAFGVWSGSL
jgi:hypothetical protein